MAIELETVNADSDDPFRRIRFGEDRRDVLSALDTNPDYCDNHEFRTKVFDILWQLAGGKYD